LGKDPFKGLTGGRMPQQIQAVIQTGETAVFLTAGPDKQIQPSVS